jgi:hypothetical protein
MLSGCRRQGLISGFELALGLSQPFDEIGPINPPAQPPATRNTITSKSRMRN